MLQIRMCIVLFSTALLLLAAARPVPFPPPYNGNVGTSGFGFGDGAMPVGTQAPFGAARVSPDTIIDKIRIPFDNFGGYNYWDNQILAFSHTHMVGAGVADLGAIGLMPFSTPLTSQTLTCVNTIVSRSFKPSAARLTNREDDQLRVCNFLQSFTHQDEAAQPGYYRVWTQGQDSSSVQTELTATPHSGAHRWSFSNTQSASLILDLCHGLSYSANNCVNASVTLSEDRTEWSGFVFSHGDYSGRVGGVTTYFVIRFAAGAVADFGTWSNGDMFPQQKTISGVNTGAYVTFKTNQYASDLYASASNPNGEFSAVIESSIGISFVSIDQARLNLANEQPSHAFDDVQSKATQTWLDLLTTVAPVVQGANNESSLFYTHLYQSFTAPTKWSESDGAYLGFDKQIHYLNESKQLVTGVYTDMSIWDIARTEYPLLAWLQPQRAADIVNSMLLLVEQSGSRTTLPKWMFLNGDTNGMVALHSILMLGDAHFGPTPFKLDAVGLDIAATSLRDRQGGDAYVKRGYADTQSPCDTIEYSMDDWCLARMAGSLGNTSVQQSFEQTSKFWRNVFHPQKKFMCARDSNGHWTDCDLPDSIWNILALNWATKEYVEGNAWHYRFFAPHDMDALVAAYGDDVFTAALEQLFVGAENGTRSNLLPDPYYWAGNEPSLFSIFGFAHQANAGPAAEAMQRHARFLLREKYTLTPDGLPGNNDYGTMSAWWLWGALGMWPLPCGNRFYFGSPALQHVVLNTPGADGVVRTLEMTATNWTADRTKVQRIRVDGVTVFDAAQPTPGALIYQADSLLSGSHHFEFNMAI